MTLNDTKTQFWSINTTGDVTNLPTVHSATKVEGMYWRIGILIEINIDDASCDTSGIGIDGSGCSGDAGGKAKPQKNPKKLNEKESKKKKPQEKAADKKPQETEAIAAKQHNAGVHPGYGVRQSCSRA